MRRDGENYSNRCFSCFFTIAAVCRLFTQARSSMVNTDGATYCPGCARDLYREFLRIVDRGIHPSEPDYN